MKKPANTAYRMMIALAVLLLPLAACDGGNKTPCRADIAPAPAHAESTGRQQAPPYSTAAAIGANSVSDNAGSCSPPMEIIVQDNKNVMLPGMTHPIISCCLCP